MDHRYEFMKAYQEQALEWSKNSQQLNRIRTKEKDLRNWVFLTIGDGLISLGYWMKKLSLTAVDRHGYSQSR